MTVPSNNARGDQPRIEYSGPEELDRVLVHLREARERMAAKAARSGQRNPAANAGARPPVHENIRLPESPEPESPEPESAEPRPLEPRPLEPLGDSATAIPPPTPPAHASGNSSEPAMGAADRPDPASRPAAEPRRTSPAPPHNRSPSGARPSAARVPTAARAGPPAPSPTPPASRSPDPLIEQRPVAPADVTPRLRSSLANEPPARPSPAPPASSARFDEITAPILPSRHGQLWQAILRSAPAFKAMAWFSFVNNILMLAGPLFMLQVYDRVMTSGSIPTLVALASLTTAIYVVIGLLELVRSRVIVRVGVELDRSIGDRVFAASLRKSIAAPGSSLLALREFDQLRQFIAGPGPLTFFDAPWTPVYLLVIFLTHWALGLAATLGASLIILLAWASEARGRTPLAEASKASARSIEMAETGQRNAESITAMGMLAAYRARWQKANGEALAWQVLAADRLSSMSALSKTLRLLMQSLMLAVGAALAIKGEISAGSIIAGTIIFGRALAPVEQAVSQWRSFIKASESFAKIEDLLKAHPEPSRMTTLPAPTGHIEARALRVAAPETRQPILANISFAVAPGQMLAVIGPSASGKSTLARALVGLWPLAGGEIRLDGARLDQWNPDQLGRHIGYLPQNVELFAGTIRENISRFEPQATDSQVIEAARAAHAHDMIMALPKGYETQLGAFGAYLSAGQRQRIGLARALFSNPALVVLDEPNANLDRVGDEALASAIDGLRHRRQAVVLISHRVQAIGKADVLLYIERGIQRAFGPRDDVLKFLQQNQGQPAPQDNQATGTGHPSAGARSHRQY